MNINNHNIVYIDVFSLPFPNIVIIITTTITYPSKVFHGT